MGSEEEDDDSDNADLSIYEIVTARNGNESMAVAEAEEEASSREETHCEVESSFEEAERAELEQCVSVPKGRGLAMATARAFGMTVAEESLRRGQRQVAMQALLARQAAAATAARAAAVAAAAADADAKRGRPKPAASVAAPGSPSSAGEQQVEAARETYQSAWRSLQAWDQTVSIGPAAPPTQLGFQQMPWPVLSPATAPPLELKRDELRRVVVPDGAEVRRAVQEELRRWHPDKFIARFGGVLCASERDVVLDGVTRTSQLLTELLGHV